MKASLLRPSRFNPPQNPPQYAGSFTSSATLNTRPRAVGGSATARAGRAYLTCSPTCSDLLAHLLGTCSFTC